jgi:hypothetical protein
MQQHTKNWKGLLVGALFVTALTTGGVFAAGELTKDCSDCYSNFTNDVVKDEYGNCIYVSYSMICNSKVCDYYIDGEYAASGFEECTDGFVRSGNTSCMNPVFPSCPGLI